MTEKEFDKKFSFIVKMGFDNSKGYENVKDYFFRVHQSMAKDNEHS